MENNEDWVDGDNLNCIKCNNFVDYIDENGFCDNCKEN